MAEENTKATTTEGTKENKDEKKGDTFGSIMTAIGSALGGMGQTGKITPVQAGQYGAPAVSDERLKRIFKDDNAIKAFSDIDAYIYKYNNKAQSLYGMEKGVDKNPHFGPMAQDLKKNPVTSGTVHEDENGFLNVDTRQLTLTNTAMISQLARKVQELEERLGGR